jgi:hypothetical protein
MDAANFGYVTLYLVGILTMAATGALTRYGWWIVAVVITASAWGLSAYVFAQINDQTAAPVLFFFAIMGTAAFFVAAGGGVGIVPGFLLRRFGQRQDGVTIRAASAQVLIIP